MKRQFLSLLTLFMVAGSMHVYADEICNTIKECQELKTTNLQLIQRIDARIRELEGTNFVVGDFLRDASKNVITNVSQYEAENLCCLQNGKSRAECEHMDSIEKFRLPIHLPTARQLAEDAVERRTGLIVSNTAREGFRKKETTNPDGTPDVFYYNRDNYTQPKGDLGIYWTWSSSLLAHNDNFAFEFNGNNGGVGYVVRGLSIYYDSARCVARVDR